jgi:hypothetical protein
MNSSRIDRAALGFAESVEREFGFLRDLGFTMGRREATLVRFESNRVRIDVYHGRQSYEIGLSIGPVTASQGDSYSMGTLLTLVDPNAARAYRPYAASSPAAVRRGVTELAGLLSRCVVSGLLDDPMLLQRVRERSQEAADDYANEVLLADTRRRVQAAWNARDFAQVVTLLAPVQHLITDAEREKLRYAQKRMKLK